MRSRSACQATGSKYCLRANGHQPVWLVRIRCLILRDEISSLPEMCTSLTTGVSFFCCDAHPTSDATDMTTIGACLQSPISAKSGHDRLGRKLLSVPTGAAVGTERTGNASVIEADRVDPEL